VAKKDRFLNLNSDKLFQSGNIWLAEAAL